MKLSPLTNLYGLPLALKLAALAVGTTAGSSEPKTITKANKAGAAPLFIFTTLFIVFMFIFIYSTFLEPDDSLLNPRNIFKSLRISNKLA